MRVIRAEKGWGVPNVRELWQFRDLLLLLIVRDIKLKYKQTVIGVAWVVLQPLLTALLFSVLFGYFARISTPGVPYVLFAFSGMVSWQLFAQVVQRASFSLLNDARLISKVYFPRLAVPLGSSLAVVVDFFVSLSVMFILLMAFGKPLTWHALLVLPLVFFQMLFTFSISAFLAAWNVHYRDFVHVIPFMLQLWMFATPLFYPVTLIPEKWQIWYALNPLVGFVEGFRYALLGEAFPFQHLSISLMATFLIFTFSMLFFHRLERTFADVI